MVVVAVVVLAAAAVVRIAVIQIIIDSKFDFPALSNVAPVWVRILLTFFFQKALHWRVQVRVGAGVQFGG